MRTAKPIDCDREAWRIVAAVSSGEGTLAKRCSLLISERRRQAEKKKLFPKKLAKVDHYFAELLGEA